MAAVDVLEARLPDELVRLVAAHGAAGTIQRCGRGMLGRRVASARMDETLSRMAADYLLACAREGVRPFGDVMPISMRWGGG